MDLVYTAQLRRLKAFALAKPLLARAFRAALVAWMLGLTLIYWIFVGSPGLSNFEQFTIALRNILMNQFQVTHR